MKNLEQAKLLLFNENYTFVAVNYDKVLTSKERGVKPLLNIIDNGKNLQDFAVADKVVGKAAAFLYIKLQVKNLYVSVCSLPAKELLLKSGVNLICDTIVDRIISRDKLGLCPMEQACIDVDDVDFAEVKIRETLKNLNNKNNK